MNQNNTALFTLGLVKNLISKNKAAKVAVSGIFLKKAKKEFFIEFSNKSLITVFCNGKFKHSFNTTDHKTFQDAQDQAEYIYSYIKEFLNESD